MKRMRRMACMAGLFVATATPNLLAQLPGAGAPAGAGGAGAGGAGAAPAAAAAAPKAGFLKRMCDSLEECKRKICKTPAGVMLNNMTKPLTAATGGIIPPFCPQMPNEKDLAQSGVAGAAAAGKKDALEAAARRDNVRYLGTLDCRYFPDAAKALATALRADASECVRYEAALVLARGCCCSQLTLDALEASVSGTDQDGNPAERSPRVRCAAAVALEKCTNCYVPPAQEPEPVKKDEKDQPKEKDTQDKKDKEGDKKTAKRPDAGSRTPSPESVARARQTLAIFNEMLAQTKATMPPPNAPTVVLPKGRQSVFEIIRATSEQPTNNRNMIQQAAYPQMTRGMSNPNPVATTPAVANSHDTMPVIKSEPTRMSTVVPSTPAVIVAAPESTVPTITPTATPAVTTMAPVPSTVIIPSAEPVAAPTAPNMPVVSMMPTTSPTVATTTVPTTTSTSNKTTIPASTTTHDTTAQTSEEVIALSKKVIQGHTAAERHTAIRQLVKYDWKKNPMVASALILGAKVDKESAVRVDCLRHLVAFQINHPQVLSDVMNLCNDNDSWVRAEATQAYTKLKGLE